MGFVLPTLLAIVASTTSPGLTLALQASAAPPVVVDIRYRAPAECPSDAWFYADVLGRIPEARRAEPGETARTFDVSVVVQGGKSRAALEFVDAEGRRVRRELEAHDCAEVVAGIAVVTAVAIDPRLGENEHATPAHTEPPPKMEPEPGKGPPIEPPPPHRVRSWSFGAYAGAVSDVAPVWAASLGVFSELSPSDAFAGRLTLGVADSGEVERDEALLRFWLLHGGVELCPLVTTLTPGLRLLPCIGMEVGAVHGEGRESPRVAEPAGTTDFWLAGTLAPALELEMTEGFFLELEGQLRVPLLHRTYVLERPEAVVYETPTVGYGVFLGLGLRLAN